MQHLKQTIVHYILSLLLVLQRVCWRVNTVEWSVSWLDMLKCCFRSQGIRGWTLWSRPAANDGAFRWTVVGKIVQRRKVWQRYSLESFAAELTPLLVVYFIEMKRV